jgi:hypothetical protein
MKEPRSCRGRLTDGGGPQHRSSGRRVDKVVRAACLQNWYSVRGRERREGLVKVLVRVAPPQVGSRRQVLLANTRSRVVPSRRASVRSFPPASASTCAARENAKWSRPDRPTSFRRSPRDEDGDQKRQEKEEPSKSPREVGPVRPVVLADQERLWSGG